MEELYVFMLLFDAGIASEATYLKKLDALFLKNPESRDLLYLEQEPNIDRAVSYMEIHVHFPTFDNGLFRRILLEAIAVYYQQCTDIKIFSEKTYHLWNHLPQDFRDQAPFNVLCYAGDSLSWGDEQQTRALYEHMLYHGI